jgi:quercetin dioxygenase-like cupin family protein
VNLRFPLPPKTVLAIALTSLILSVRPTLIREYWLGGVQRERCGTGIWIMHPPQSLPSAVYDFLGIEVIPTPVGERRKFIQTPTATLDDLGVYMTTLNPGQAPHPPHQHPDEEMILIREGTLEITINDRIQRAGPGSVVFVAPNDLHGWRNVGENRANYFVLRWTTARTAAGE